MIHWQFHCNEIHTIWYLLLNMFSIAVILMKHIYMYNTTFCLNSQSLAFFFLFYTFFFFCYIYTTHTHLDDDVFPQNINLVMWNYVLHVLCISCVLYVWRESVVRVCVHMRVKNVGQFDDRSPFCYAGQLTLRHNLWAGDVFLLMCETQTCQILVPDTELNTSDCYWSSEIEKLQDN